MSIFNSLGSNYRRGSGVYAWYASPKAPSRLKALLKRRYDTPEVTLTYKGREAITLALASLDLPAGSKAVVNGYTCYAVHQAVTAAGLEPLYLDIEPNQLNFTVARLSEALKNESDICVVMIQNTLGMPADALSIKKLCDAHNIPLVEDLAHCIGLVYEGGKEAGTLGSVAVLSFSQDKMIDAVSGGAALLTKTLNVRLVPATIWHRFTTRLYPYSTAVIRGTMRIQVGRVLLKGFKLLRLLPGPMSGEAIPAHRLPAWHSGAAIKAFQLLADNIEHRQNIAAVYRKWLPSDIQFVHMPEAVYLRFPIRVNKPTELIRHLRTFGFFLSDRWYDAPIAPKKSLQLTTYKNGQCPNAEVVSKKMVNLPTHTHINEAEARQLAEHINQWMESQK